jgi:O-antigen biosynthesis protein
LIDPLNWRLKRLHYLLRRVAGSVTQRGVRGTMARIAQEFKPRATAQTDWELEPLGLAFTPFALPVSDAPVVSVIIPVHGKLAYTLACLRSIAKRSAETPFEVIVIDDASPDESAATLSKITGLRLIRNERNLGFVGSCNAGADVARGSHLLFLNNDTQVTPGWLDRLLDCFGDEPLCGIAGSRLVYPDGRLQEAGGIIFSNGDGWNVGRFQAPEDPQFRYRRDADYVSGASLMIERAVFMQIGGFDTRYSPAYYEDTDLAFAVRAMGKRVIYQPESVVIHFEGITSGTDLNTGVKQYQLVNKAKFVEKWHAALAKQPTPDTPAARAIQHDGRPHILIIDALTPDPSRDSGSLRMVNIMRLLASMGWRVTFMADNCTASDDEIRLLGRIGVQVLCKPWSPSLARWLKDEKDGLHAVMLSRHYIASPNIDLVRRVAPNARVIFDTVDLHFLRERRTAEHAGNTAMAKQAQASRKQEFAVMRACDVTLVVSPVEKEILAVEAPDVSVEVVSNVHEVFGRHNDFAARRDIVFVGGFGHPPNVDAVKWLVHDIYPRIRQAREDISLHLLGDIPDAYRHELQMPGVIIHGRVAELDPWMNTCKVALAPLRFGAGVKGKVNMAMSYGLPVVATSIAAEGMWLRDEKDVLIADDADTFAHAVLRLYDDPSLWLHLSDQGLENVRHHFSFEAARAALQRAVKMPS